jgi:acyl dehydratase
MNAQSYFEEVPIGSALPRLTRDTSVIQLLQYAGASRDYNLIHHDRLYAREAGLPDTISQGSLKAAFLGQLVTNWAGNWGSLRELEVQYRGIDIPGVRLVAGGVVVKKALRDDEGEIECEIWLESPDGERNTRGRALLVFPLSRG